MGRNAVAEWTCQWPAESAIRAGQAVWHWGRSVHGPQRGGGVGIGAQSGDQPLDDSAADLGGVLAEDVLGPQFGEDTRSRSGPLPGLACAMLLRGNRPADAPFSGRCGRPARCIDRMGRPLGIGQARPTRRRPQVARSLEPATRVIGTSRRNSGRRRFGAAPLSGRCGRSARRICGIVPRHSCPGSRGDSPSSTVDILVDEDLLTAGGGERVVLGVGMLVAGGDPSVADSHARECIANPRRVDVGADTATVTDSRWTPTCGNELGPTCLVNVRFRPLRLRSP